MPTVPVISASPAPRSSPPRIAIVGGGPAGLMAAEVLARNGLRVDLFDAMPSVGRKFLLAGKGGLNLTHSEAPEPFVGRYGKSAGFWRQRLTHFGATELREWAEGLGVATFIGSSGRVFPREMKAAPLLRAWLRRLRAGGVRIHPRHRLTGIVRSESGSAQPPVLILANAAGEIRVAADAILLALGGASWPQLGSDGAWVPWLAESGVAIEPLRPANCGFDVLHGWTEHFRTRFAGAPLKGVRLHWTRPDGTAAQQIGEFVITDTGVEGSLIYAASAGVRDMIAAQDQALVNVDLLAQRDAEWVRNAVSKSRGARSLSTHLKARLGLEGVRLSLLYELLPREVLDDPLRLAAAIKALPLRLQSARPIAEAISSVGGVRLNAIDERFMLAALPGVFCAGEMLDWEAPTGGYLLTACFSSGVAAGEGICEFLHPGGSADITRSS